MDDTEDNNGRISDTWSELNHGSPENVDRDIEFMEDIQPDERIDVEVEGDEELEDVEDGIEDENENENENENEDVDVDEEEEEEEEDEDEDEEDTGNVAIQEQFRYEDCQRIYLLNLLLI
jgi:hypothetical protein